MSFSNEIKVVRMKAFLTQSAFAKEINVSYTSVNRWENEKGLPNISTMKRIKDFCQVYNIPYKNLEVAWLNSSSK